MTTNDSHDAPPRMRPLGIRHSLARSFLAALEADFKENATDVIQEVRNERPLDYLKIVIGLLPGDAALEERNPLEEMSNDELARVLRDLRLLQNRTGDPPRRDGDGRQGGGSAA